MILGYCPQCGLKIGERTANGVFRYMKDKFTQVILWMGYPDREALTQVHVPVCKDCAKYPDEDKLILGLNDDRAFQEFKTINPDTFVSRISEETTNV